MSHLHDASMSHISCLILSQSKSSICRHCSFRTMSSRSLNTSAVGTFAEEAVILYSFFKTNTKIVTIFRHQFQMLVLLVFSKNKLFATLNMKIFRDLDGSGFHIIHQLVLMDTSSGIILIIYPNGHAHLLWVDQTAGRQLHPVFRQDFLTPVCQVQTPHCDFAIRKICPQFIQWSSYN